MDGNRVEVIYKEEKGRYTITTKALSEGKILFVWKPYVLVPYVTYKDQICANCISISIKEKIPCRQNCSFVYYCSNQCEKEHWNKFHQYECLFLKNIFQLENLGFNDEVVNYCQLVMRILTQRFKDLLENSNEMSIDDIWISSSHFDKFTKEKTNEFELIAKLLTKYILTQLICEESKDWIEIFLPNNQDVEKVRINNFDLWFNELIESCSFINNRTSIESLLKKVFILICIEEINALFHITFRLEGYTSSPQTYAMGFYPSAAFVNHSCSPNLARFPIENDQHGYSVGDVVYFATRSIRKGEEICYSYLERDYLLYQKEEIPPDETIESQMRRKQRLKAEFFFDCNCIRCENESNGIVDLSYMNLIKQLKCQQLECKGWFIPSFENQMICQACETFR
ncbi:hypothetical protein I4U23_022912 [Adineta vaga]|nr:hypothetical protein I4U23_022912 [Adineta vaga]